VRSSVSCFVALCSAVAFSCRPEPTLSLADLPAVPQSRAVPGALVSVTLVQEGQAWPGTVEPDGTLLVPMCGAIDVASASADEVCERVLACVGRYFRRPHVHVEVEAADAARVSASCEGETVPPPTEPSAEMQGVLERLAGPQLDAALMRQAIEAVTSLDADRERKTDVHPDVVEGAKRVGTLLAALPGHGGADQRSLLGHWLAQRSQALNLLRAELDRGGLAEKHPRLVAVVLAQARVQRVRDALGTTAELEAETWVDAIESGARPPEVAASGCAARRTALDRRIAYWRGRAAEGASAAEVTILDVLALAHAQLDCG
jgi:hypothetical protein